MHKATVRDAVTILRRPDGKWSGAEVTKVLSRFGVTIYADHCSPGDIAMVGNTKDEDIEAFRLAHPDFGEFKVLHTYGTVR